MSIFKMTRSNMKKFYTIILKVFLISLTTSPLIAASTGTLDQTSLQLMNFYHHPSYKEYIDLTTRGVEIQDDFMIYDFASMALTKNPKFVKKLVSDFPTFSKKEKKLIFTALLASNNKDAANEIRNKFHYNTTYENFHTVNRINTVEVNDRPAVLDAFWSAYFATGNSFYLEKILNFINSNDELLIFGYEIINRENINQFLDQSKLPTHNDNDIQGMFKKRYGKNWKKMFVKAVAIGIAISSMESNRQRDAQIQHKYALLIKKNASLDYWKKINMVLG